MIETRHEHRQTFVAIAYNFVNVSSIAAFKML